MASAEKRHRVRLVGTGMIYEKHYPGQTPLVVNVPAGATVEVDEATMNGWKKMNAATGRPTQEFEVLKDDEEVDVSIPDFVAEVEKELVANGVNIQGVAPTKPTVGGSAYKGIWDRAIKGAGVAASEEKIDMPAARAAQAADATATTKKGGA